LLHILTPTPSSHKEILDMEIQVFHEKVTEFDPKWLIDRIQRMASGEAPFFPTTLSCVYDELLEKAFAKCIPFGPGPGGCDEGESLIHPAPPQASTPTSNIPPPPIASSSNLQALAPTHLPVPSITNPNLTWLKCRQCDGASQLRDLRKGMYCPQCPAGTPKMKRKILMQCSSCNLLRGKSVSSCERRVCKKRFL